MAFTVRATLVRLIVAVVVAALAACGNNAPSAPPSPPQHLYVGVAPLRASDTGEILQFTLPITGTSTASVNISTTLQSGLAVDINGNIAAGDRLGHLAVFNSPLSNSSTPAIFNNGTSGANGQLAFSSSGDLFAPDVFTTINLFAHPLTAGIAPSQVIVSASLTSVVGAALDSNGDLIVTNRNLSGSSNLVVLQPPYTGASLVTPFQANADYLSIALNSTQLFVADFVGKRVDVYNLPLGPSSVPAFSITNGVTGPQSVALDSNGNLYVANTVPGNLIVYNPPFSSSSAPKVILSLPPPPSLVINGAGIAIGK